MTIRGGESRSKPAPKRERRGGWSGGPVPDGRAERRLVIVALLVMGLVVGLAAWVILRL